MRTNPAPAAGGELRLSGDRTKVEDSTVQETPRPSGCATQPVPGAATRKENRMTIAIEMPSRPKAEAMKTATGKPDGGRHHVARVTDAYTRMRSALRDLQEVRNERFNLDTSSARFQGFHRAVLDLAYTLDHAKRWLDDPAFDALCRSCSITEQGLKLMIDLASTHYMAARWCEFGDGCDPF